MAPGGIIAAGDQLIVLKNRTRTLATATALETGKGEFARGMAMGTTLKLKTETNEEKVAAVGNGVVVRFAAAIVAKAT